MKPHQDALPKDLWPFVWRYLSKKKVCLFGFLVVAVLWAVDMSLSPYLIKVIIDAVIQYANDQSALMAHVQAPAALYVTMSLVMNANFRLYDYVCLHLYPYLKSTVDKDMFAYLLDHSYDFFQSNFTGTLTKKISDMAENAETLIEIPNVWFLPRVLSAIIASATLCTVVQPIFGGILLFWALSYVYCSYRAALHGEKYARTTSEAFARMDGVTTDSISNVVSTHLFANKAYEVSRLETELNSLVESDRRLQAFNLKVNFFQDIGVTILMSTMLSTLIYGSLHHWVSPGDFGLVMMLSLSFMFSVQNMGKEIQRFSKVIGTCNQALSFVKIPHDMTDVPEARPLKVSQGKIQFEHVSFGYNKTQSLFRDLTVTIQPGEKIGLVGYSGAGKSTFIKLILRLADVNSGRILIDDQDIKTVVKESIRKQIGTIPQEPDLFHRTLMENIRFARIDATDADVIEAAKKARCHEFIMALPEQYRSLVGERGVKLSGGQKQRIAIARAILKDAPILLLDEATSALDSSTEKDIQAAFQAVMATRTTLVIAHRLSTLKHMDRIFVFDEGDIVAQGGHEALLVQGGLYKKLWEAQVGGMLPDKTA